MKSIIQTKKQCFTCGAVQNLQLHHTWHGTANRKLCDKDGLTVWLCLRCHMELHDKGINDRFLMEIGERAWLKETGKTVKDFIERYGKNVIYGAKEDYKG